MALRDPRTKEELLDRMMRSDFTGDLRDLGKKRRVIVERPKKHVLELLFPSTDQIFYLTVRRPRPIRKKTAERVVGAQQKMPTTSKKPNAKVKRRRK